MKQFFNYTSLLVGYLVFVTSCNDNLALKQPISAVTGAARSSITDEDATNLKKEFAIALAKALKISPALRSLIKSRAQEMIDEDYDVLYHLIKKEKLENGITVRDLIAQYYKNKGHFQVIEKEIPTLTIFVPRLPNNIFSAETWDINTQIPQVAVKLKHSNDVPILDSDGTEILLKSMYIPARPVIVVKESLRMIDKSHPNFDKINSKSKFKTDDGLEFKMLDDAFDRKLKMQKRKGARLIAASDLDNKVITAYNIFSGTNNWHRDYIYYNLIQSQDRGAFDNNYEETITIFRMNENDPRGSYDRISDQTDDPRPQRSTTPYDQNTFWTSSSYTFRFKFLLNGQNGTGTETIKYVPIPAHELFIIQYERLEIPFPAGPPYVVYLPQTLTCATYFMNERVFKWNLNSYSTAIKCEVEEVDENVTTVVQEQTVSKFAVNFGIDAGEEKKFGLKFGINSSQDKTVTYTRTLTQGNDPLGETIIEFSDNVIVSPQSIFGIPGYKTREYSGGFFTMSLEPTKVQ